MKKIVFYTYLQQYKKGQIYKDHFWSAWSVKLTISEKIYKMNDKNKNEKWKKWHQNSFKRYQCLNNIYANSTDVEYAFTAKKWVIEKQINK